MYRLHVPAVLSLALTLCAQEKRKEPWNEMDYGPCLSQTIEGFTGDNFALKGRVVFLGDDAGVVFDSELLRVATMWTKGRLQLRGTPFDGAHGPCSRVSGQEVLSTKQAPGWAKDGSFADPRKIPFGTLPKDHARFDGHWMIGRDVVMQYHVGARRVLETYELVPSTDKVPAGIARVFEVGPGDEIRTVLADLPGSLGETRLDLNGGSGSMVVRWSRTRSGKDRAAEQSASFDTRFAAFAPRGALLTGNAGRIEMTIPSSDQSTFVRVVTWTAAAGMLEAEQPIDQTTRDISGMTRGGARREPQTVTTEARLGEGKGPFVVDTFTLPSDNPWHSWLRFAAFDFVDADTAALCTWNGDVWLCDGITAHPGKLTWSRFCTGLHDPLGLRVVDGVIYTHGRDGLYRLRDVNHDGECDFVEVFNNDVQITQGFHEFAFDLQTDAAGNFYFAKAGPVNPGGRGFQRIVDDHGTVMRVSADGSKLDVIATGLRAPNGIGVSADGVVTSCDNHGTWMPACRLNISTNGSFWGCVDTAQRDPKPTTYDQPICFLPMNIDNSSGGQVWIPKGTWGALGGMLIHQSYGQSTDYLVLMQQDGGRTQGGVVRIPASFESSQMRGRFHQGDLYTVGFQGWQTNAAKESAFQRVRRTDAPLRMPLACSYWKEGIELTFSDSLDVKLAQDPQNWDVEIWNYKWSEDYGSPEFAPSHPDKKVKEGEKNRDVLKVVKVEVSPDGRHVFLAVDGMQTVMQIRVAWSVDGADGEAIDGEMNGTIHFLLPRPEGK